jgi:integrase
VRTFFKWCLKDEKILQPPRYGAYFDPPGKRAIRLSQNDKVQKRFTRDEILRLLDAAEAANFRLYAAILLALNTGCQNVDIETLQMNDIDFKGRWYSQMRAKKGTKRKSKLWPRTVKALKRLAKQNGTGEGNSQIFKSKSGGTYSRKDCLSKEFATLRKECGITTKGAGFQWIRHTFFDTAKDRYWFAAKKSMGHEIQDVAATYTHDYDAVLTEMSKYVERRFF